MIQTYSNGKLSDKKQTIRLSARLYWSLTLPAIALLSVGGLAWWGFEQINHKIATIYDDRVVPLQQLKTVSDGYAITAVDNVQKVNAGLRSFQEAHQQLVTDRQKADQAWEQYRKTLMTEQERAIVQQTESILVKARQTIGRVESLLSQGDRTTLQGANAWLYAAIDPLTADLNRLIQLQLDVAAQERQAAEQLYGLLRLVFILALIAALALASPVGYALGRTLTATLRTTIDRVAGAASEIAAATEENERVALQQSKATTSTQAAMVHLNELAQNIAGVVAQVAEQARLSSTLVEHGSVTLQTAIEQMEAVRHNADTTATRSRWLADQAGKIGKIATLVDEFSRQTTMLALNASLEAIRAGDHGREFAVVAHEIRDLAERSGTASNEINLLVADLQQAIAQTADLAQSSNHAAQDTTASLRESAIALTSIAEATHSTDQGAHHIDSDASQELQAIQQVLDSIQGLHRATEEGVRGLSQTRLGMEQLNKVVLDLQAMV